MVAEKGLVEGKWIAKVGRVGDVTKDAAHESSLSSSFFGGRLTFSSNSRSCSFHSCLH
jgi:hypothetical protein